MKGKTPTHSKLHASRMNHWRGR